MYVQDAHHCTKVHMYVNLTHGFALVPSRALLPATRLFQRFPFLSACSAGSSQCPPCGFLLHLLPHSPATQSCCSVTCLHTYFLHTLAHMFSVSHLFSFHEFNFSPMNTSSRSSRRVEDEDIETNVRWTRQHVCTQQTIVIMTRSE
jgi:hypothetical protein